jgi:TPR repeat protein
MILPKGYVLPQIKKVATISPRKSLLSISKNIVLASVHNLESEVFSSNSKAIQSQNDFLSALEYEFGTQYVKKDLKLAYQFYEKSALAGDLLGMYKFGYALQHAYSGIKNSIESMNYLKKAADAGILNALNNYGIGLLRGYIGEKNPQDAMKLFSQLHAKGHLHGTVNFAYCLEHGYNGVPDPRAAASFYKLCIDQGSISALHYFACVLENGSLGQAFPEEALKFFKMAAELGHSKSQDACFRLKKYEKSLKSSRK